MSEFQYSIINSIIFNLIIFFSYNFLSKKINLYDLPNPKRKIHKKKVPIFGGLIVYFNIILYLITIYLLGDDNSFIKLYIYTNKQLIFFIFTFSLIFFVGLYDDKHGLSFDKRLLYLFMILILFTNYSPQFNINKIQLESFNFILEIKNISSLFLTVCIISYLISCNMFDGINLQSPIYFIFILIVLIYKSILFDLNIVILFSLVLIFYLNLKKKTFFGDGGIYLMSFLISYSFIFGYKNDLLSLEEILLLSFTQLMDAFRVILSRIFKGKNPTYPDQTHIHHILINKHSLFLTTLLVSIIYVLPCTLYYIFKINILFLIVIQIILYFLIINFKYAKRI